MVPIAASAVVSAVGVVMVVVSIVVVVSTRFRPFVSLGVPRFGRMITFRSIWTFRSLWTFWSLGILGSFWTP
jgi:hypothetical protein